MADDIVVTNAQNQMEESLIVCYAPTMITTNGIWQGDNPLDYSLPLFIVQLTLVVAITRLLVIILKPIRQPRVIAEILVSNLLNFPKILLLYDCIFNFFIICQRTSVIREMSWCNGTNYRPVTKGNEFKN